jgi:Putative transposase
LALSVELRVRRWLVRRGLLRADAAGGPDAAPNSAQRSALDALPAGLARRRRDFSAARCPCRSRAPLSLERLSILTDGRVAYQIKNPRGKRTHRLMTPTQFLARLSALIPPPRHPLIRVYGVFAPHSAWRSQVVALADAASASGTSTGSKEAPRARRQEAQPKGDGSSALLSATAAAATASSDGRFRATRIDWAALLKRTYDIDALACPCGGRLRIIALILEPKVASAILTALHLPDAPPPIARARAPDYFDASPDD